MRKTVLLVTVPSIVISQVNFASFGISRRHYRSSIGGEKKRKKTATPQCYRRCLLILNYSRYLRYLCIWEITTRAYMFKISKLEAVYLELFKIYFHKLYSLCILFVLNLRILAKLTMWISKLYSNITFQLLSGKQ